MKKEIELPIFTGYYNTIFDESDNYQETAKDIAEVIGSKLVEMGLVNNYNFIELFSPNYYNYSNDVIYIEIDFNRKNIKKVLKYLKNNIKNFDKYLKNNFTSGPGFISYYSNETADWLKNDFDEIELSSVLDFILKNQDLNLEWLFYEIN